MDEIGLILTRGEVSGKSLRHVDILTKNYILAMTYIVVQDLKFLNFTTEGVDKKTKSLFGYYW